MCGPCGRQGRQVGYLGLKELRGHLAEQHWQTVVSWRCNQCGRCFPGVHNWYCHRPHCRGPQRNQEGQPVRCGLCGETFARAVGLSQHERHRHPRERNDRRAQQLRREGAPGRRAYRWTEEETERLSRLCEEYRGVRNINKELLPHFPGKTRKQISDKRRGLAMRQGGRAGGRPAGVESASSSEPESSDEEEQDGAREEPVEGVQEREGGQEAAGEDRWAEQMMAAIEEAQPRGEGNVRRWMEECRGKWREHRGDGARLREEMDRLVDQLMEELVPEEERLRGRHNGEGRAEARPDVAHQGRRPRRRRRRGHGVANNTRRKRYAYARCQELFNECPRRLAEMAVQGDLSFADTLKVPPRAEDIRRLYSGLWGEEGPVIRGNRREDRREAAEVFPPVRVEEVRKRIVRLKCNSAAGLDGVKKAHLQKEGVAESLAMLFNILLREGHYPAGWKRNRTTLIPKEGKDLQDARNWRPITIGSMAARVFSALIDQRIRGWVEQTPRQKGFTAENGCSLNISILNEVLAEMKEGSGGVVAVLDVTKAFDTVPHSCLQPALERKGVPGEVSRFIPRMYDGCTTTLRGRDGSVDIELRRGVKQGDPLSPLLFNLAIEAIVEGVEEGAGGAAIGEEEVSILAFADDLVLLAKDAREAQRSMRKVERGLARLGMSLAADKCAAFQIVAKEKTWYTKDPGITVGGMRVPEVGPEESLRYLGVRIGPWKGLIRGAEVQVIVQAVKNVRRLKLKPHQKMELLQTFVLSKFVYSLMNTRPSKGTLRMLDQGIRQEVKEILHLPQSTPTSLFYAPKAKGGLGLTRFERSIQLSKMRVYLEVRDSEDPVVREISRRDKLEKQSREAARAMGHPHPITNDDYERIKRRTAGRIMDDWEGLATQHGVRIFRNDRVGNAWLTDPTLLTGSRYLDAIRLRTNTYGTRDVLGRTNPRMDTNCRRCRRYRETLGHVLGLCIHTKPERIHRHNEIRDFIAGEISRRHTVVVEPTINEFGELKKPDLVIKKNEEVIVADVTVRYEKGTYLEDAAREKVTKYRDTAELARVIMGGVTSRVLPIVVGSRGAIPKATREGLQKIGLTRKDLLTISLIALRSSIEIANAFMDYDDNRERGGPERRNRRVGNEGR